MTAEHFVIAGVQRGGTTYLAETLSRHPEIEMASPPRPEPKFFLSDHPGSDLVGEYRRRYFGSKPSARVFGEKSTSYLEYEHVARRLVAALPDVRVVVVVRDPVERAISHWRFSCDNGLEPRSAEEALCGGVPAPSWDEEKVSVSPFAYRERGHYIDYIERFLRHVDRARLHVVVFEEMVDSLEPLVELCDFLGVSTVGLEPPAGGAVNPSRRGSTDVLSCRARLAEEFADSTRRLEKMLGRPLDRWSSARSFDRSGSAPD